MHETLTVLKHRGTSPDRGSENFGLKLQCHFDAIPNVQLLHDVGHVVFYGSFGAIESFCYPLIGHASRD